MVSLGRLSAEIFESLKSANNSGITDLQLLHLIQKVFTASVIARSSYHENEAAKLASMQTNYAKAEAFLEALDPLSSGLLQLSGKLRSAINKEVRAETLGSAESDFFEFFLQSSAPEENETAVDQPEFSGADSAAACDRLLE